jgi:hypothetical protein
MADIDVCTGHGMQEVVGSTPIVSTLKKRLWHDAGGVFWWGEGDGDFGS